MLLGSLLMANPDIDLIGLIATVVLAIGFLPYGLQLMQQAQFGADRHERVVAVGGA